ncbi:MAG: DUF2066 domain-containing protein [Candidatus Porifericomitaceae bacterium WSBS_2022_MAG_OTU9]
MNIKILMATLLLACSGTAVAFDVDSLYEVRVAQEGTDRNKALQAALDVMLLRLTGDATLLADSRIELLRRRVESYIQSYEYVPSGSGNEDPWLRVLFARESLVDSLSDLNIPSWGVSRPETLVWFVAGDLSGGHRLLRLGDDHPALHELERWSNKYGLPLVYPLLDLEDVSQVDSSKLWVGFDENLRQASRRYGADAVVLVKVDGWQQGQWQLRWNLYVGEETLNWSDVAIDPAQVVEAGVGRLATELSVRFGIDNFSEEDLNSFSIKIAGVTDFSQMAKVITYLSNVHAIRAVQLKSARRGELQLNLLAALDKSGVQNAIALSTLLVPIDSEDNSYRFNAELH